MAIQDRTGFDPADWGFLGAFYTGDSFWIMEAYSPDIDEAIKRLAAFGVDELEFWVRASSSCESCGSPYFHGAAFINKKDSTEIVFVGAICANDHFGQKSVASRLTRKAKKAEERADRTAASLEAAAKFLDDNDGLAEALEADNLILLDMNNSLSRWGKLSVKQVAFAFKLAKEAAERAEELANAPEETLPVTGRYDIEAVVINTKWVDNDYGGGTKVLLQVEDKYDYYRLWGTLASPISDAVKGDRVRFSANVTGKEEGFGFFSRPTKAVILEGEAA